MKMCYRKSERKMSLCLLRFSQNVSLRALSSRWPSLPKTSYPSCKELGANYQVREKSPNETTLTSDISCRFGGGVRGGVGRRRVPQTPSGSKFSRKTPRTHCKVVYSQLKGTNYNQPKRKRCIGQYL